MIVRYLLAWFPMVLIAVVNGALRDLWYGRRMSELTAHQASTVGAIVLFGAYIWGLSRVWPLASDAQALAVGCLWLVLTLAFEIGFFHFAMGHPWSKLLGDYNLAAGRIWVLVPLWVTLAPWIFFRLSDAG